MALRRSTLEDYAQRILRAEQLLQARLDVPVLPADVARQTGFSLHHFHRIFRAQVGESMMQYLRRLRLERAARRLRVTDDRILDVALEAGYDSHEAFTRAFAEQFEMAPSAWRAAMPSRLVEWRSRAAIDRPIAHIEVRTLPAYRVAFMRHRGGYASIDAFWQNMVAWSAERGLLAESAPLYGLCPDDPDVTPEEQLRFDACVLAPARIVPEGVVGIAEIPAGTYAIGLHIGSYKTLSDTYLDVIGRWFPKSGYELATDAVVEHYLNDPSQVPEHELRTEVCVRIAE